MRGLRCVCIVLCLFVLLPVAFAKPLSKVESKIATRWVDTPVKKLSGDKSITYTKAYERFVRVGQKKFSIATASYSHLIEKKASESISEIVNGVKTGYGESTKWKMTPVFNGVSMVGDWKEASRTVHVLLFRPAENQFVIFSALTKSRYDKILAKEVQFLKDRILRFHNKKKFSFFSLILATGWAQSLTNPFAVFDPDGDDALHTQELSQDIRALNTSIERMNVESDEWQQQSGFWQDESGLWRHESGAWRDESGAWRDQSNNFITESANWRAEFDSMIDESGNWRGESDEWQSQLQAMSDKWGIEVDELQSMLTDESGAWQQLLATESASFQQLISSESKEWRDIVGKFVDPMHMAKVAFATAAGAALGTLAVNLIVDGAVWAAKKLFDIAFDISGKEDRWKRFAKAREIYEEQQQSVMDLEKTLDAFLNSFESITDLEEGEDILDALERKVETLSFEAREKEREYNEADDCLPCREAAHSEQRALEKALETKYLPILKYAREKGIRELTKDDKFYCDQLDTLQRKLIDAELALNDSRIALINGEAEWFRNELKLIDKRKEDVERINVEQMKYTGKSEEHPWKADATKLSEKLIKKIEKDANKVDKKNFDDWVAKCIAGQSEIGKIVRAEVFFTFQRKDRCEKAFTLIYEKMNKDATKAHEKLVKEAKDIFEKNYLNARKIEIRRSHDTELQHIQNMMRWFEKLKAEAYCYGKMDENPKHYMPKCEKISPQLVSLRKNSRKATEKWKEMCASKVDDLYDDLYAQVLNEAEELEIFLNNQP